MIVKKHRQKTADAFIESGQQDLNLRPLGPQPSALPSYAIPRSNYNSISENERFEKQFV